MFRLLAMQFFTVVSLAIGRIAIIVQAAALRSVVIRTQEFH